MSESLGKNSDREGEKWRKGIGTDGAGVRMTEEGSLFLISGEESLPAGDILA